MEQPYASNAPDVRANAPGVRTTVTEEAIERSIARAERLADLLDRAYQVPGTNIRFGLDAIIGLIPVVGDTATAVAGLYPVMEGKRHNIRKRILARMLVNLGVDWLIGLIPLVDIVFDVAYKANVKNARLLAGELRRKQSRTPHQI